ncbi:MAG: hypothetical protein M1821_002859 [Bathelium mastoideum]|nr:MAG: hypothetical protein M1821_002859 [Bathelium mastoideum]
MPLTDLLKKKDKISSDAPSNTTTTSDTPQFTFLRTTTDLQETIEPPTFPDDPSPLNAEKSRPSKLSSRFRKSSSASSSSHNPPVRPDVLPPDHSPINDGPRPPTNSAKGHDRSLSARLHLHARTRSRSSTATSTHSSGGSSGHVPVDLPDVGAAEAVDVRDEEGQAQWEARATVLARSNGLDGRGRSGSTSRGGQEEQARGPRSRSASSIGDVKGDARIQRAIELHERGDLEASTQLFGVLADPEGANNALSQVLYGLALRHGWGCDPVPERAVTYLSLAASNSAEIESLALDAGMKKGGAAKGELVLAIFELANCFRNGWGIAKEPTAARKYYETAANLGDTDAMNEVAWCYLEGFGGKKDKVRSSPTIS